jgi:hypothetical protein
MQMQILYRPNPLKLCISVSTACFNIPKLHFAHGVYLCVLYYDCYSEY